MELFVVQAGGGLGQCEFELGAGSVNRDQSFEPSPGGSSEARELLERFQGTPLVHIERAEFGWHGLLSFLVGSQ